jgi:ActR/RegA family two-component response regulator
VFHVNKGERIMMILDAEVEAAPSTAFVDDDPQFLETMRLWQESVNVPQRTTDDKNECLTWVKSGDVDAVICDLRMPGFDGVSLLEEVHRVRPSARLYLLTGFEPTTEERKRLDAISAEVLYKMTDLRDLLESLTGQKPNESAQQLIDLQSKVATLEGMHREWTRDLVESLEAIPNASEAWVSGGEEPFTIADMINDIKTLSPRGLEHVRLWRNAQHTLRELRTKKWMFWRRR